MSRDILISINTYLSARFLRIPEESSENMWIPTKTEGRFLADDFSSAYNTWSLMTIVYSIPSGVYAFRDYNK